MKKHILNGFFVCLSFTLYAQTPLLKGIKYFATTISVDGNSSRPEATSDQYLYKMNSISVSPSFQFGKFISDKKMIGVGVGVPLNFYWGQNGNLNGTIAKFRSLNAVYTLSPYMRHYKSLNPRWAIFLTSAVDLAYRNFTQKSQDQKYSLDGFSGGLRLTPGISYFVTPRFALETDINLLSLGAGYQKFDGSESFYFSSAVTTSLTSYFSVRASWYIQKP